MRNLAILILQACAIVVVSILIGGIWWRIWMYHDGIASPHWLSKILQTDGEGSYQATMLEMILFSFIIIVSVFFVFRFLKNR